MSCRPVHVCAFLCAAIAFSVPAFSDPQCTSGDYLGTICTP
jgi:hypothetical protein